MNDVHINILINNCKITDTINSLHDQSFQNITVFLINNQIKNIHKFIDSRFVLVDKSQNMNDVINQINDGYTIIINDGDIFRKKSLENIARMIYLTDADVINFSSNTADKYILQQTNKIFRYVFQKNIILNHVFDYPSNFCIKHEILKSLNLTSWSHLNVIDVLKNAKDMTTSDTVYILQKNKYHITEYKDIIDYYVANKNSLPYTFWKKYFSQLIPKLTHYTMVNNDKDTFVYCAKNIDHKLIPLKYKLLFFIMKILN